MAVKWAVANGVWSAGATWNGGVVPTADDVVYLNSHNITVDTIIVCKSISNLTSDYSNNGGYLILSTSGNSITADIYFASEILRNNATSQNNVINGNVYGYGNNMYQSASNNPADVTINGNILLNNNSYLSNRTNTSANITFNINGTLLLYDNSYIASGAGTTNVNVTGVVTLYSNSTTTITTCSLSINGELRTNTFTLSVNKITFNHGGIICDTLDVHQGVIFSTMTINDQISFYWRNSKLYNQDYPAETDVKKDVPYAYGQMVGTYDIENLLPPESVVLKDYEYGDSDDRKTGTMVQEVNVEVGCVTPEDVRKDVPLVGMGVVGSLVVPSVDDVREGVIFDNGSVGTLIVQGGGDRLRIADFGYYTNAQSDTYIVDLTEQDKPKFAVAEERVLIEMFPDLDLENIPDKYFDDLFVKYLKYRLIVEYYRTAGINSTFTPSEPTTEIVNYQNVRNEVWLNSANIYLKAWAKKYPDSVAKPQRILL